LSYYYKELRFLDLIREIQLKPNKLEGECGRNIMYTCMKMEKWELFQLFQEWGKEGIKENDGGDEFNYDTFKNFCKCHSVPPAQQ
jgi:hypothetical protein